MPIYEFECQNCKNIFESLCFCTDNQNEMTCPDCGKKKYKEAVVHIFIDFFRIRRRLGHTRVLLINKRIFLRVIVDDSMSLGTRKRSIP